jgi:hypothetical protein
MTKIATRRVRVLFSFLHQPKGLFLSPISKYITMGRDNSRKRQMKLARAAKEKVVILGELYRVQSIINPV